MSIIVDINLRFNFRPETLFLAFNIFDRILLSVRLQTDQGKSFAFVALYLAAKVEEVYIPDIEYFTEGYDKKLSKETFIKLEKVAVKALKFEFLIVNPYFILERFHSLTTSCENKKLFSLTYMLLEVGHIDYDMLNKKTSSIVLVAMRLARQILNVEDDLEDVMKDYLKISKVVLVAVNNQFEEILKRLDSAEFVISLRKFNKETGGQVSENLKKFLEKLNENRN